MEKSGEALDHELEIHQREQEMEEGSKASTSFDQWEVHSMDGQISKMPNPDPHESDDVGLSKSFRISIIVGSILIMIAVILAISVFLPHNSKHNQKLQHGRSLLDISSSNNNNNELKHLTEIRVSCEVTQFYSLCTSAVDFSDSRSQQVILTQNLTTAENKCLEFLQMGVVPNITESAPDNSDERFIMSIRTGVYQDMVKIPSAKFNLMLVGSNGINTTVIMGNPTGDSALFGLESNVLKAGNRSSKSKEEEEENKSQIYCDCQILEGNASFQWIFKNSYSALSSKQSWSPSSRNRTHVSDFVFENCTINVTEEYFLDPQAYSS